MSLVHRYKDEHKQGQGHPRWCVPPDRAPGRVDAAHRQQLRRHTSLAMPFDEPPVTPIVSIPPRAGPATASRITQCENTMLSQIER